MNKLMVLEKLSFKDTSRQFVPELTLNEFCFYRIRIRQIILNSHTKRQLIASSGLREFKSSLSVDLISSLCNFRLKYKNKSR